MPIRVLTFNKLTKESEDYIVTENSGPGGNGILNVTQDTISVRQGVTPINPEVGPINPVGEDRFIPVPEVGKLTRWDIPGTHTRVSVFKTR